ncbi:hypothetical protein D3P96_06435 [Weissella viridescens]|uniref:Uncharacterized protein n=1 Tax=Weissella viridescens TaxID=1629 RepID=A0A3P2RCT7_WEIVI|nr:hypothetical protein D3P96_06435 [Weissella viridescens]
MLRHINIFWIIAFVIFVIGIVWFVNYKAYYMPTKNRLMNEKNMSKGKASFLAFIYTIIPFLIPN